MVKPPPPPSIDPDSGFCPKTNTFYTLRPPVPLPPPTLPLSLSSFAFSLLPSPLPSRPAFINATTSTSLSYANFLSQIHSLSSSLTNSLVNLSKGDVAFVLSPSTLHLPVLYFSLLSLGVVVSPANPSSTPHEISRLCTLVNPVIAFATSSLAFKLPPNFTGTVILLDSPNFSPLLFQDHPADLKLPVIHQTDPATIMFSSGTTGLVKAAALSHQRYITMTAGMRAVSSLSAGAVVNMLTSPMFHSMGFAYLVKGVALGETTVVMDRPGFGEMMSAVERYGVTVMTTAPPVVAAMGRSEEVERFDLKSLKQVLCGGAPLPVVAAERFRARLPWVQLRQGYGATETGAISMMINEEECSQLRSVGRLSPNIEAMIVDIVTGKPLSVGQQGELLVRGPAIMIGYVGDKEANASTFRSEGWLKTGDLCYFHDNGFLYIVDRLKELIKYKAYQVSPMELEQVLQSLPDIVDVAVTAYPDEEAGQIPMALVVRKPGKNLEEAQVIDYVAKRVAPYKKIRKVAFVNSIPKSQAGKILRRELATYARSAIISRL